MAKNIKLTVFNLDKKENKVSFDVRVKTTKDQQIVVSSMLGKIFAWKDLQRICNFKAEGRISSKPLALQFEVAGKKIDTLRWKTELQQCLTLGYSGKSKERFKLKFNKIMEFMLTDDDTVTNETLDANIEAQKIIEAGLAQEKAIYKQLVELAVTEEQGN